MLSQLTGLCVIWDCSGQDTATTRTAAEIRLSTRSLEDIQSIRGQDNWKLN